MIAFGFWIWRSPVYSFHPTCTYTVNARVVADVEVEGERLSAEVVYQNSRSRQWLAQINSAGCKQHYGTALAYKTRNDHVLIVSSRLCYPAEQALARTGEVDILGVCIGKWADREPAFMVDSATRPSKWREAANGIDFRILKMTAVSTWANPVDDIALIAPNLLKSKFSYRSNQWSKSPERLINFHRRYNEVRHRPDNSFEFEVVNERF